MEDLTPRQTQVLEFIRSYTDDCGMPPTLREISSHLGTSGTVTALHHIEALEKKGYLSRREGSSRGIVLSSRHGKTVSLPVAGIVKAGAPSLAVEDIEGYLATDSSWVKGEGCFYLKVSGDSMKDAHILDGDLALIRPQNTAENGDIVVAMVDGEATLKRFFMEKDRIRLQPENSCMDPIYIKRGEADVVIIGRLLRIVRSFDQP